MYLVRYARTLLKLVREYVNFPGLLCVEQACHISRAARG